MILVPAARYDSKILSSLLCEVNSERTTKTAKATNDEITTIVPERQLWGRLADLYLETSHHIPKPERDPIKHIRLVGTWILASSPFDKTTLPIWVPGLRNRTAVGISVHGKRCTGLMGLM